MPGQRSRQRWGQLTVQTTTIISTVTTSTIATSAKLTSIVLIIFLLLFLLPAPPSTISSLCTSLRFVFLSVLSFLSPFLAATVVVAVIVVAREPRASPFKL